MDCIKDLYPDDYSIFTDTCNFSFNFINLQKKEKMNIAI